ncbi:MAG: Ig-like domain-containing protein [Roseburia sp.]|nr:Ig-like domain-containing protein [Roseburia sp.]
MYKDVVKRVIAWVLVLCMIGGIPDVSLWAAARISDGNGNHTYALVNGDTSGEQMVFTNSEKATITNVFTMEKNDRDHAQELESVKFALNYTNSGGETERFIQTADYEIAVRNEAGTVIASATGKYEASDRSGYTVRFDGDDIILGSGDKVSVSVKISNPQWVGDDGENKDNDKVAFRVGDPDPSLTSWDSKWEAQDGTVTPLTQKPACIYMTTRDVSTTTPTSGITFDADNPTELLIGETAQLSLTFTPNTASQKNVTWTSLNPDVATVDANGTVRALSRGNVRIHAALTENDTIDANWDLKVCKSLTSSDIRVGQGGIPDQTYTGQAIEPSTGLYDGSTLLGLGVDYYRTYDNNVNAGTEAKEIFTGISGNFYKGRLESNFTILPASLNNNREISVIVPAGLMYEIPDETAFDAFYAKYPDKYPDKTGATAEDVLEDQILTDLEKGFTDGAAGSTSMQITYNYRSQGHIEYLKPDRDYTITARKLDQAGSGAYIEITGKGNYTNTLRISIPIKKSITHESIKIVDANVDTDFIYPYTGEKIKPAFKVMDGDTELKEGVDYQLKGTGDDKGYFDSADGTAPLTEDAGTKYIIIEGIGAYAETPVEEKIGTYKVTPIDIGRSLSIKVDVPKQVDGFTAATVKLDVTFNGEPLTKDTDFEVEVKDAESGATGRYDVIVKGLAPNFTGEYTEKDVRTGIDLEDPRITFAFKDSTVETAGVDYMGGKEIRPEVVLTDTANNHVLVQGTDYKISYSNNKDAGTATIRITGADNSSYAGVLKKEFTINQVDVSDLYLDYDPSVIFNVRWSNGALNYDANQVSVAVTYEGTDSEGAAFDFPLVKDRDYTIAYANIDKAGTNTASFTITGAGKNFKGSGTYTYTIDRRSVSTVAEGSGNTLEVGFTNDPVYTGKPMTGFDLGVYVKHNNATFTEPKDPSDSSNTALEKFFTDNFSTAVTSIGNGKAIVQVVGKDGGNYIGPWIKEITIAPFRISNDTVVFDPIPEAEYDPERAIEPEPVVHLKSDPTGPALIKNVDYTVSYSDNSEAGDGKVTIEGHGNYTGSATEKFTIYKNLDGKPTNAIRPDGTTVPDYTDTIKLIRDIPPQYYTGKKVFLQPEDVVIGDYFKNNAGVKTIPSTAYTMPEDKYDNNIQISGTLTNPNRAKVTVTGGTASGYYRGSREFEFDIVANTIASDKVTIQLSYKGVANIENFDYTGEAIRPDVTVYYAGEVVATDQYDVYYENNVNVGSRETAGTEAPHIIVIGKNNFGGISSGSGNMKSVYFDINPKKLNQTGYTYDYPTPETDQKIPLVNGVYNPRLTVTDNTWGNAGTTTRRLKKDSEYTVTCTPWGTGDDGWMTIAGTGNYGGSVTFHVLLEKQTITSNDVQVTFAGGRHFTYTGANIAGRSDFGLTVRMRDTGKTLVYGQDYTVSAAGGFRESDLINYNGGSPVSFKIDINNADFKGTLTDSSYNFIIDQKNIADDDVRISVPNQISDGSAPVDPTVKVTYNGMTLTAGTDYTFETKYDGANDRHYVTVKAIPGGNYRGEKDQDFGVGSDISFAEITLAGGQDMNHNGQTYHDCFVYQAAPITPEPTVTIGDTTLKEGTDYTVAYEDNEEHTPVDQTRRAKVIITGIGKYAGEQTKDFIIAQKNVFDNSLGGSVRIDAPVTAEFTGSQVKPDVNIVFTRLNGTTYKLEQGKDYDLSGVDLVDVGTGKSMTITFKDNFYYYDASSDTRYATVTCNVVAKSFKDAEAETDAGDIYVIWEPLQDEYEYTGAEIKPTFRVLDVKRNFDGTCKENGSIANATSATTYSLKDKVDYDITWRNNDRPGTAELILTGKGNYKNERITKTFKIKGTIQYANVELLNGAGINKNQYQYTGSPVRPDVRVYFGDGSRPADDLRQGKNEYDTTADYWCEYVGDASGDLTQIGVKTMIIHGINDYAGSDKRVTYEVVKRQISEATVAPLGSFAWTGEPIHPVPQIWFEGVLLKEGRDFTCEYSDPWGGNCTDVNDDSNPYYLVTVTATGNFEGKLEPIEYKIGDSFTNKNIQVHFENNQREFDYTGETIIPKIMVQAEGVSGYLKEGEDYRIAIEKGDPTYINAGKKTFRIYGIDTNHPFIGSVEAEYTIKPIDLSSANARVIVMDEEGILTDKTRYPYEYYGRPHMPEPSVVWWKSTTDKKVLSASDGDFIYDYENNVDAGTATVIVRQGDIKSGGTQPNFTGERRLNFNIDPVSLTEMNVDSGWLEINDLNNWIYTVTGQKIKPNITIRYKGDTLIEGQDYDIEVSNAVNIGDAQATIEFKKNYTGTFVRNFKIVKRSIVDPSVRITMVGGDTFDYTGETRRPEIQVTYEGTPLAQGTDYTLEYGENIKAGPGTVKVTGINNFDGDTTMYFTIAPIDVSSSKVEVVCDSGVIKNGQPAEPKFTVYWVQPDSTKLRIYANDDPEAVANGREIAFTYRYYNNTAVGMKGHLEINGINNFTGTRDVEFDIGSDIEDYIASVEWANGAPSLTFNNTTQKPAIKRNLTSDSVAPTLSEGKDYEIVYEPVSDNADADVKNAGEYQVFIKGINKYAGRTNELQFNIAQRNISNVPFEIPDAVFTGSTVKPNITAVDTQIGVTLVESSVSSNLTRAEMANAYTTQITGDTVNAGRVSVAIIAAGNGNYTGSVTKDFNITPKNLVGDSVTISPNLIEDQIYTGGQIMPKLTIVDTARNAVGEAVAQGAGSYELTANDYTITYTNNVYPGEATVTITGKGNYQNRIAKTFTINADLSMAEIAPIPVQAYTGSPVTPALVVTLAGKTLIVNQDYTVTYQNNVNRGIATATITANPLGGYTGEKTVTFEIGRDLAGAQVRAVADAFTYTGSAIVPQIAVIFGSDTLKPGIDYTVEFANNVNVGTATVTVTGQGVYSGTVVRTFEIIAKNVARCSFSEVETKLYNRQATSQNLVVTDGGRTLVPNQDYSVTYVNNTNPGTATIQIAGLGNYGGMKTIRYNIEVKPMTSVKASSVTNKSVKLSWSAVDSAEGYAIYNGSNRLVARTTGTSYTVKKLNSMKSYSYRVRPYKVSDGATYFGDFSNTVSVVTLPSTPGSVKVKAGKKQVKISWKKVSGVTGYEVYRSTKKSSGYKKVTTIKKASTTSYTNKKLSSKKKYYFKVRAYKTVNGKKLYSAYSSPKQVKVK